MDPLFAAGLIVTVATAVPVLVQMRRQPRGLFVLFFAEMWERFSYYGMRGLLIFYLTEHFLFGDRAAQGQYGAYTSLAYLAPLFGGFLADRFLGTRKAATFGALLLVAGHFVMAIEGPAATQILRHGEKSYVFEARGSGAAREVRVKVGDGLYPVALSADGAMSLKDLPPDADLPAILPKGAYALEVIAVPPLYRNLLYLALSLIIVGVGLLKPNISSIAGQLYAAGDPRRDSGFTLYYYGINLGAFWAAIACGWLGQTIGWWAGFGAAGVGMLAGLVVFVAGKPWLDGKGEPPEPARLATPLLGKLTRERAIYLCALLAVGAVWALVQRFAAVGFMLAAASAATLLYLAVFMAKFCAKIERKRLMLALVLIASSVVFWTLFEQAGTSLNQFAERNTNLGVGAFSMTAAQTQSFNAGFVLILAPLFAGLWAMLGRRGADPNPAAKFGLALIQAGLGFFALVWGAEFADANARVPLMFLALAYLLHTTGELCLSPVGLSQMTRLSPAATLSTVMATWFLATSWAQWIGGRIAQLTATETIAGAPLDSQAALKTYAHVFALIGSWGIAAGALLLLASPWLKRWAHSNASDPPAPRDD